MSLTKKQNDKEDILCFIGINVRDKERTVKNDRSVEIKLDDLMLKGMFLKKVERLRWCKNRQ